MGPNPPLGVVFHWLGGLSAASFYIPYRSVKRWDWETYWLVGGVFSWIIAPWVLASLLVPDLPGILRETNSWTLVLAALFGALWGVGGLTFGLSMRYLGIALGYAVALGLCAAFGTLVPPIVNGEIGKIAGERSGQIILLGVAICLTGIAVSGLAGRSKEREMSASEKREAVAEFSFSKGLTTAVFAGIMSACFAYGLAAGKPISVAAKTRLAAAGYSDIWQNLPVLVVVLWGGFATNFIWCLILNRKNRTGGQYIGRISSPAIASDLNVKSTRNPESCTPGSAVAVVEGPVVAGTTAIPLLRNYLFSALAGVTWYFQFFFYSMGQTRMGKYDFSSWTLHMASIIIFSTLWGIALREWRGTSRRTHALIATGLFILIGSTMIVGYGNFLKAAGQ